jgi:hypothetical protein
MWRNIRRKELVQRGIKGDLNSGEARASPLHSLEVNPCSAQGKSGMASKSMYLENDAREEKFRERRFHSGTDSLFPAIYVLSQ